MRRSSKISDESLTGSLVEYHLLDLPWSTVGRARERGRRPGGLALLLPNPPGLRTLLMTGVSHVGR